jgi:hypothetical protein
VRKDLLRPEPALLPDDDEYRFRHLLIRDTAYEALPKAVRAELHERFATWLEEHGAGLVELDEIVGYHLEQAYRYRQQLGPLDPSAEAVAARAVPRLVRSAERARDRGDIAAAAALQARAVDLLGPDDAGGAEAQVDLAVLLGELGEFEPAAALRESAAARASGDERLLARCALAEAEAEVQSDPTATMAALHEKVAAAYETLERVGDDEGAIWGLRLLGTFSAWLGDSTHARTYWMDALARTQVRPRLTDEVRVWLLWSSWWGPTPADECIRLCDEIAAATGSVRVHTLASMMRASLIAMLGEVDEGRRQLADGRRLLHELGDRIFWSGTSMMVAELELYAGDLEHGLEVLAEGREVLAESAGTGYLATVVGFQGHLCLELGRDEEALRYAAEADSMGQPDDFEPHARAAIIRGVVAARNGDFAAAETELAVAAELVEPRDYLIMHLDLAFAGAEVARLAARPEDARRALEGAQELAAAKGSLLAVERARAALARVGEDDGAVTEELL